MVVVDKDGKHRESLKDVAAFLEPLQAPRNAPPKQPLLKIRTVGKRFIPRVGVTTTGSAVAFPNQDHIIHNVFSLSGANRFDTGHYEPGDTPPPFTTKAPGLVKLYCNVHHKMNAFLWVVDTPFYQLLDGQKGVDFKDVPAGTYRLRLWHPETGDKTWTVTIAEGVTVGKWELGATLPPFEPHTNKFGKPYPPAADEGSY